MRPCSLLSLATAVPPNVIEQAEAKALARRAFGGKKALFDRLSGVFDNAGIARRHIVAPPDWYGQPHGWADRNAVYLDAAEQLFIDAATCGDRKSGTDAAPRSTASSPFRRPASRPRASRRASSTRVGFRDDIRRVPVFGLGCAGGVNGLALASRLAAADPGSCWLFVTVETCSISIRLDSDDPAAVVATALFGDGAAAAVVTSGEHSLARDQRLGRETVAGHAADHGLGRRRPWPRGRLRPRHPAVHRGRARGRRSTTCARRSASPATEIDRFCCHPGGVKVIDAIETALELNQGELNLEREVLRDYGNMSAPTVLFVLDRLLERGLPDKVLMTAFGPGFTCAGLLLEAA